MTDANWVQQERDHEYRMAKFAAEERQETRKHRTERLGYICIVVAVVAVVSVIAWLIWSISTNAGREGTQRQLEHEKTITACTQSGGCGHPSTAGNTPACTSDRSRSE